MTVTTANATPSSSCYYFFYSYWVFLPLILDDSNRQSLFEATKNEPCENTPLKICLGRVINAMLPLLRLNKLALQEPKTNKALAFAGLYAA